MIRSSEVLKMLAARHSKDVFVPECKDGPTWFGGHSRLDAWVMRRSWSRPCTWGYEIKVNRGDFLRDSKWHEYLPLCSEFYFVAPKDVIGDDEIPEQAGLLRVSSTGSRLFMKRKAPHRDIEPPVELLYYVIMRAVDFDIDAMKGRRVNRREYWKEWIASRDEDKELGYRTSVKIRRLVEQRIERVERENARLLSELEGLQELRDFLGERGLKVNRFDTNDRVAEILGGSASSSLISALRSAAHQASEAADALTAERKAIRGGD